jgi:uncharacterized membrane protein
MSLGFLHFVLALLAIASGAYVLVNDKGTAQHRWAGWLYVGSMAGLNVSALFLYNLTGSLGPFHVLAIASLATVSGGFVAVRFRVPRAGWRYSHAYWMAWSYVGLLAALAAETATRIFEVGFWWLVALSSGLVIAVGGGVIARRMPRVIAALPESTV